MLGSSRNPSKTQENFVTTTTIGQALLGGEVAIFALELVVLKSEKCEFGAVFVTIGRFLKTSISLVSIVVGGPMIRSTCAFVMPGVTCS